MEGGDAIAGLELVDGVADRVHDAGDVVALVEGFAQKFGAFPAVESDALAKKDVCVWTLSLRKKGGVYSLGLLPETMTLMTSWEEFVISGIGES